MDKENRWKVCERIYSGSADQIELIPHNIAVCKSCAILPPKSIEVLKEVSESQLKDLIKHINIVVGLNCLDKKEN